METVNSSAGQRLATQAASEFGVLTSGGTQERGAPCFLFRSAACQVGWPIGHCLHFLLQTGGTVSVESPNDEQ